MKHFSLLAATLLPALAIAQPKENVPGNTATGIQYPKTKKVDHVDDYFGTKVADPYRWLENDTAADVKAWVEEQNKVTYSYLNAIPYKEKLRARITEIINYEKYSSPFRIGEYYFFSKNNGLQNQSVYYYQKGLEGKPEVFLDPNTMSGDGTAAVGLNGHSNDNKYIAYSVNQSGSDWETMYVMDIASHKQLPDKLEWVKFSGAAWQGNGFYYSRYDAPIKGKEFSNKNEFHKVYYHKLGDAQEKDQLIYEDKQNPLRYFSASLTEDERFLILGVSGGTSGSELWYKDLKAGDKEFKALFRGFKHEYDVIDNVGDKLLVLTNDGALNYQVVLVDPKNPGSENWKKVVPEKTELLQGATSAGGHMFITYLKDASSRVIQFSFDGKQEREIQLPTIGTAVGFGGKRDDKSIFYTFTSYLYPPTIYKFDIAGGTSEVFRKPDVKFNFSDYETKQVFFTSKDGTKVPMSLVYKKGIKMDGSNPTYLYGYGGFNINITASFSASRLALLENGGIYAEANLRGGREYGESWHMNGMLLKKQNVFDDFISAAEYLIKEKYTSPAKLAISGRSNGGLLVGACMTQRPDLYKVAFPAVGVMDMLRYHKFTVGWGWAVEYGSSDSLRHFKNLYAYSPLHNLKEGTAYPATLVSTADHDDRVVPAHSFKFAATLQEKHKGANPVLIRISTKSGHGAGKPTAKVIEETAEDYAFMFYNMGHKLIY